jgi:hypothetical protein
MDDDLIPDLGYQSVNLVERVSEFAQKLKIPVMGSCRQVV